MYSLVDEKFTILKWDFQEEFIEIAARFSRNDANLTTGTLSEMTQAIGGAGRHSDMEIK